MRARLARVLGAMVLTACDAQAPAETSAWETLEPVAAAIPLPAEAGAPASTGTLAEVARDPDPFARVRRLAVLLPTLGPEALPEAQRTLEDSALDLGGATTELLLLFWASHDPEAASHWAVEACPPAYRSSAVLATIPLWAASDPEAALDGIQVWEASRPDVADLLVSGLVRGWFSVDQNGVAQFIQQLDPGIGRQRALASFVRILIQRHGVEAAMRWAESVPETAPRFKLSAYRRVGAALPLFSHDAALRWCQAHCEGPHGNNLRSVIARRWAHEDGASALEWLASAPDEHENRLAVRTVFAIWSRRDREGALAWMAARSPGPDGEPESWLEPAFPVYARLLARQDPEQAAVWAARIEADEEREIVLVDIARSWRASDEAAAEAWLATSPLSEEARERSRAPQRQIPMRPNRGG